MHEGRWYFTHLIFLRYEATWQKKKENINERSTKFIFTFFFFNPKISKLTKNGIKVVENYVKSKNKYRSE